MEKYIDGFVFPILRENLENYLKVAKVVADIWKEHGAIAYHEFRGDDLFLEGTRSFAELVKANEDEIVIFGWVVFHSHDSRNMVNKLVAEDPRMKDLIAPLTDPSKIIFDASKMFYGGFKLLI